MDTNINYIAFDFVEENSNEISPENVEVEILTLEEEIPEDNELLKLGENTIDSLYIGDQRIIQMYLNGQQLL